VASVDGDRTGRDVQGKSDVIRLQRRGDAPPEKARSFADAHGFRLWGYEKLLADPGSTRCARHAAQFARRADMPPRERASTSSPKNVRALLERRRSAVRACAEKQLTLAIGYNWRFQPRFGK